MLLHFTVIDAHLYILVIVVVIVAKRTAIERNPARVFRVSRGGTHKNQPDEQKNNAGLMARLSFERIASVLPSTVYHYMMSLSKQATFAQPFSERTIQALRATPPKSGIRTSSLIIIIHDNCPT